MKIAQHPDTRQPVAAMADAPVQALCPHCGGGVTLRHRKQMNGHISYFWRHVDSHNRSCQARSRPGSSRR